MKRLFTLLLGACLALPSMAQFTDKGTRIQQWDAGVMGFFSRDILPPATGVEGLFWFNATSGRPDMLAIGSGLLITSGVLSASGGGAPACATITDATATGCSVLTASNAAAARTALGAGTSSFTGAYSALSGLPTLFSGAYVDLTGKPSLATVATSGAYADLTSKPTIPAAQVNSDWSAVSGVAQILNKPTIPTITAFNFSLPSTKTIAVSTDYQAADPSKAAIITPSFACTNNTTLVAASACTMQVRMGSSTVTCSTGTVVYTVSQTVNLGLLFTQAQTVPAPIFLPIGGHLIACSTAGTFTISAVEQSAG